MRTKNFLCVLLILVNFCYGQIDTIKLPILSNKANTALTKYVHFLKKDSAQKNTLIIASYSFMYTNQGKVTHGGRGTYLGIGINLARFFSKEFVLGATIELKAWKGLWPDNFTDNFISDFNNSYQNTLTIKEDSAKAEVLKESINGNGQYTRRGTFYSAFGITFSPYPQQYGGFMLIVKKSGFGIPINGTYGTIFNPDGADWVSLSVPVKYNVELVIKPLTFFKKINTNPNSRLLQCSIFYERLLWKDANFYGLPIQSFLSPSFIDKYAIQDHFGFTFKIGIY